MVAAARLRAGLRQSVRQGRRRTRRRTARRRYSDEARRRHGDGAAGAALRCTSETRGAGFAAWRESGLRSEEHTSELQSLMRISYAVFCLKKKKTQTQTHIKKTHTEIYNQE